MIIPFAAHCRLVPDFVLGLEVDVMREPPRGGWIEIAEGTPEDIINASVYRLYCDVLPVWENTSH